MGHTHEETTTIEADGAAVIDRRLFVRREAVIMLIDYRLTRCRNKHERQALEAVKNDVHQML